MECLHLALNQYLRKLSYQVLPKISIYSYYVLPKYQNELLSFAVKMCSHSRSCFCQKLVRFLMFFLAKQSKSEITLYRTEKGFGILLKYWNTVITSASLLISTKMPSLRTSNAGHMGIVRPISRFKESSVEGPKFQKGSPRERSRQLGVPKVYMFFL